MDRAGHELLRRLDAPRERRSLAVRFAESRDEIRAAQRLRWRVFAGELGARLGSREHGVDEDIFDEHCRHLVVHDESAGEIIGTYRLLPPEAAKRMGCCYADAEFDLTRLWRLRPALVEVGRSCIHPDHRSGAVIALLWSGLARYMLANRYQYLAGCASMSMADGGRGAAAVWRGIREKHLAPIEFQVQPRRRLMVDDAAAGTPAEVPPLIKAYLRCGAWVCGEPAWDPEFNTADFFMLLPMMRISARYARHFLGESRPS
jgi:putative hemolysin